MRIALVVPGGVDRSGEHRVIPALLALIRRLALRDEVHVLALRQEDDACDWDLAGARIHNVGSRRTRLRAVRAVCEMHRSSHFALVHAVWSGACGQVAVAAAALLGIPSLIHVAGGELVALPEIGYGGRLRWRGRISEGMVLRAASVITAASAPVVEMISRLGLGLNGYHSEWIWTAGRRARRCAVRSAARPGWYTWQASTGSRIRRRCYARWRSSRSGV